MCDPPGPQCVTASELTQTCRSSCWLVRDPGRCPGFARLLLASTKPPRAERTAHKEGSQTGRHVFLAGADPAGEAGCRVRADASSSGPGCGAHAVAGRTSGVGAVSVLRLQEASVPWGPADRTAACSVTVQDTLPIPVPSPSGGVALLATALSLASGLCRQVA